MNRLAAIILVFLSLTLLAEATEKMIDCRVIVGGMRECIPYSSKLLKAKEVNYQKSQKKLIVDKTLPLPPKKGHLKVISVEDMIERYVKVEEPKRFKGTEKPLIHIKKPEKKEPKPAVTVPHKEVNVTIPKTAETNASIKPTKPPVPIAKPKAAEPEFGIYKVKKGDTLSKIALIFSLKINDLLQENNLTKKTPLHPGQALKIPLPKEKVDAIVKAKYKIKQYDSLISIAKYFGITPKALADANGITRSADIYPGRVLDLPLPYKIYEERIRKKAKKKKRQKRQKLIHAYGKRKLRVTATAYTSHGNQTDSTPFIAAWNNRLRPGMKVIAVSRDLIYKYGLRNGTKVKISGLPGYYRVRDKMNKRFKRRIDIYMGTNRRKALRWGRRSVVIYW